MEKNDERLYNFICVNLETIKLMFSKYDTALNVIDVQKITTGMSTSNYIVFTNNGEKKFLLKVYPENNDHSAIEIAAYNYAQQFTCVPKICFCDNSKTLFNKTYVILQFIDGFTLGEYLLKNEGFSNKLAFDIGSQLALLHNHKYESMALLNDKLQIDRVLLPFENLYEFYIKGLAGKHISEKLKKELLDFVNINNDLIKKIAEVNVLSHGDFIFSNILIDSNGDPWFIDFEYSMSAPPYYDIGKFFRTRTNSEKYMDERVYKNFMKGYNSNGIITLADDWVVLSKIADITSMLGLINRVSIPEGWIGGIEEEIRKTISITNSFRDSIYT